MVRFINRQQPREPSTGEKLSGGLNEGMKMLQQYQEIQQQNQQLKQQNEQIKNNFGVDLSGVTDPDERKIILGQMLKQGAPQKPLTSLQQSQEDLNRQKIEALKGTQEAFGNIFGQNQGQGQMQPIGENQGPEGQQPSRRTIKDFDDQQLIDLASFEGQPGEMGIVANQAKMELQERKEKEKLERTEKTEKEKRDFEREKLERREAGEVTKPLMIELQQSRKNIPLQEQAIEDIKSAAPAVGTRDYLADITGFEPLRSSEGAQLKTAIKDFFLSDLTRVGARPNQWIEQQLADALPKLGRSPEANLITAAGMKFKVDLAKKRIELIDDLAERDMEKYGFQKKDIDSRANALMKPYVEQRKKDLIDEITKIKSDNKVEKGFTRMKNPETGETYDILENNVKEAKKAGWEII